MSSCGLLTHQALVLAVLQAYQAELLGDLDEEDTIKSDDIAEILRATDLSLRATKETAKDVGWSMAALLVTERHLWLTLSQLNDRDRAFRLHAPVSCLACSAALWIQSLTGFRRRRNKQLRFSNIFLAGLKVGMIGRISPNHVQAPHIEKSKNGALPFVPVLKDRRAGGAPGLSLGKWRI